MTASTVIGLTGALLWITSGPFRRPKLSERSTSMRRPGSARASTGISGAAGMTDPTWTL